MTRNGSLSTRSTATRLGRGRILDATRHCLCGEGYDATTIRRIAARLDCAIGSIYRYFADKDELLEAVTQRLIEPVVEALESGVPFANSVQLYAQLAGADSQAYRLMFWLGCNGAAPKRAPVDQGSDSTPAGSDLPEVVSKVIDGWARHLDDRNLALRCWAMAHGSIIAGFDPADVCETVMSVARRGDTEHDDKAMAQIVTLLREPARRAATVPSPAVAVVAVPAETTAAAGAPPRPAPVIVTSNPGAIRHDQAATDQARPTPQVTIPVEEDDDDVCLL